jgi:hypothetical protein
LAWGYYPRQVVRKRSTPFTPDRAKGLGIFLGLAAVLAAVLMFAIISEIMEPGNTEDKDKAASEEKNQTSPASGPSLVGGGNMKWKTGPKQEGKTYSEYKGRPKKKKEDNLSSWERFKAEEMERKKALEGEKLTEQERESREGMD